jgi:hypothetical protein
LGSCGWAWLGLPGAQSGNATAGVNPG